MMGRRNKSRLVNIPPCYVLVRKLTLEEVSRFTLNPLFISHRCGYCQKFSHYSPKCKTCSTHYHIECAYKHRTCCGNAILPQTKNKSEVQCPLCKDVVDFGPQCSVCKSIFHSYCITPYQLCCQLDLCLPPKKHVTCRTCNFEVNYGGPKCPFCSSAYHYECVKSKFECCGIEIPVTWDDKLKYQCHKCFGTLQHGTPMCQYCGQLYHRTCVPKTVVKRCCRKFSFELYFIPSFKYMDSYLYRDMERRNHLKERDDLLVAHSPELPSTSDNERSDTPGSTHTFGCQINPGDLGTVALIDVKEEIEQKEIDIPLSPPPPVLDRETDSVLSERSMTSYQSQRPEECDEHLRRLFDLMFDTVRTFPPEIQAQVKQDMFKTVTQAEIELSRGFATPI